MFISWYGKTKPCGAGYKMVFYASNSNLLLTSELDKWGGCLS